jgi:hypothetical protein
MACTVVGTSPAEMKMIGMSAGRRRCASQLETVDVRRDIEYQAAGQKLGETTELLCGRECRRLPTLGADQQLQRLADRGIVVNDEYDWGGV